MKRELALFCKIRKNQLEDIADWSCLNRVQIVVG